VKEYHEILEENHIPHKFAGDWVISACPFCDDPSMHLGYNSSSSFVNCWRCGFHSTYDTLSAFGSHEKVKTNRKSTKKKEHIESCILPSKMKMTQRHVQYAKERGLTRDTARLYKIGGTTYFSQMPNKLRIINRLLIPICVDDAIVSYTCRKLSGEGKRYINCPSQFETESLKESLFAENLLTDKFAVVVTEGMFDAIHFGVGAVATMGTGVTFKQLLKLSEYKNVYLMMDNDKAGVKARHKLISYLSPLCNVETIDYNTEDVAELNLETINAIRREVFL